MTLRNPHASSPAVRRRMQAVKTTRTAPEVALLNELVVLTRARPEVNSFPLGGLRRRADFVFRRARVAVFVDGCFWHGCRLHYRMPKTNSRWWMEKIERNAQRDRHTTRFLRRRGWSVIRVWEHTKPATGARRVARKLKE